MNRRLKTGLYFMLAAIIFMPLAVLIGRNNSSLTVVLITISMILELIGLIFVILNIIKKRKV